MEPLRVAIIGGGISGLTTYLQLRKQFSSQDPARTPQLAITIFESYDLPAQNFERSDAASPSAPAIGGGYGLAANGMHSFRCLDPDIHQHILKNSFPTPRFQMRTRKGWTLGAIGTVIEYPQGPEACCMVTREVVLEALYAKVPREVIEIKEAVQVVDEETEARVVFAGGEERVFDLVVAADGIWSKTRRKVFGEGGEPEYRGLSTLGGFVETKYLDRAPTTTSLPYPQSQTIMTFGHNGFLGYSPCSSSANVEITLDHIRGKSVVPEGDMAIWWARSVHEEPKVDPDMERAKKGLAEKMASWRDPNIRKILEHSLKTVMIPQYVLPKQKTWAGRRVVLVGDAAHALPTSKGQGVSQSVADAEALAMLLAHNLSGGVKGTNSRDEALQKTFEQYMAVRKAHVERILDTGNRLDRASGDMNVVAEYTFYGFLWVMLRFFGSFFTKEIEEYDVVREVEKVLNKEK